MSPPPEKLFGRLAARHAGKSLAAWRKARQRRPLEPDGWLDGRTPYWHPATIDRWLSEAPYAGRRRHSPTTTTKDET